MIRPVRWRAAKTARRVLVPGILLGLLALLVPASASASFHLTKIREVYTGTPALPGTAYVELQAYAAGQNFLAGHHLTIYNSGGTLVHSSPLGNVPNGESQRTTLIAGGSELPNGVTPDFTDAALGTSLNKNGGAVCFDSIPVDCVAWGNFSGDLPAPGAGTPVVPSGIPNGSSITRSIAPGCSTLLEAGDDTDVSSADFTVTSNKTPRSNSEAPTEKACGGGGGGGGKAPQTSIDKGPKKKTAKKTAKFGFSSSTDGATFECSLDGKRFKPCDSPLKLKRIKPGKHVFSVRAVLDGKADKSPATYRWKRTKKG